MTLALTCRKAHGSVVPTPPEKDVMLSPANVSTTTGLVSSSAFGWGRTGGLACEHDTRVDAFPCARGNIPKSRDAARKRACATPLRATFIETASGRFHWLLAKLLAGGHQKEIVWIDG